MGGTMWKKVSSDEKVVTFLDAQLQCMLAIDPSLEDDRLRRLLTPTRQLDSFLEPHSSNSSDDDIVSAQVSSSNVRHEPRASRFNGSMDSMNVARGSMDSQSSQVISNGTGIRQCDSDVSEGCGQATGNDSSHLNLGVLSGSDPRNFILGRNTSPMHSNAPNDGGEGGEGEGGGQKQKLQRQVKKGLERFNLEDIDVDGSEEKEQTQKTKQLQQPSQKTKWGWLLLVILLPLVAYMVQTFTSSNDEQGGDGFTFDTRPDLFGEELNIVVVGNPGTGKSTLLNSLVGDEKIHFGSGLALGSGVTTDMKRHSVGKVAYIDTPGLADVDKQLKAAEEIRKALSFEGYYKVFFLFSLRNGRVILEDKTTMALVLLSAPIKRYGIIVNRLSEREMSACVRNQTARKQIEASMLSGLSQVTNRIYYQQAMKDLQGKTDAYFPIPPKLRKFIDSTQINFIPAGEVTDILVNDWEKLSSKFREVQVDVDSSEEARQRHVKQMNELEKELEDENEQLRQNLEEARRRNKELAKSLEGER